MHAEHCLRSVLSLSPLLLVILAESGPLSDHLLSRVNNPHSPNLPELPRETRKRVDLFSNKAQHLQFSSKPARLRGISPLLCSEPLESTVLFTR